MTFHLEILNITQKIFSNVVKKVNISGSEGELGIYPGHTQLLTSIRPGLLYVLSKTNIEKYAYISGGILEIQPSHVIVLADTIFFRENLNKEDVLNKKKKIEKIIKNSTHSKIQLDKFKKKFLKVIAQLHVIEMYEQSRLK